MRILMISDVFFPRVNGVSTSIETFARQFHDAGHAVTLIAPEYGAAGPDSAAEVIRVPSRGVIGDPEDRMMQARPIRALLPRLRARGFDVVHIHTPFVAHYLGVWLARRLSVPVVESYHTYFEEYLHHYLPWLPGAALRFAARRFSRAQCNDVDAVVVPSTAMRDALARYGVNGHMRIIPTGVDPDWAAPGDGAAFRTRLGIGDGRPIVLFVGRVAHEKNIEFLVRMFRHVREQIPDALLLLAGEGPARASLEAIVTSLGLAASTRFVGYLSRAGELRDCYAAADVFVFASRTETQGLVLLESLALGTPVVSTAVMGTADVLTGAAGAVVVQEDPQAFAAEVVRILSEPHHRARLAMAAPSCLDNWSAPVLAGRMLDLYASVA